MGFNFNFLKDLNKERELASKTFGFLKRGAVGTGRTVSNVAKYGPESFIKEAVPQTAKSVRDIGVSSVRSIPRGFITTSRELSGRNAREGAYTPRNRAEELIIGKEPIQGFREAGEGFGVSGTSGTALGAGLTISDLFISPGKKGLEKLTKETIEKLAKEGSEQGVKKILGKDIAPEVASAIAKTGDVNIVENLLRGGSRIPKEAPVMIPPPSAAPKAMDITDATIPKTPKVPDVTVSSPVESATDPFEVISETITGTPASQGQSPVKGLATARRQQNELLSRERGQRFGAVSKLGESEFGSSGYFKRRAALKGEYSKVKNPYRDRFAPEEAEQLFEGATKKIYSTPDSVYEMDWKKYGLDGPKHAAGAKFNTEIAVRKALGLEPGIPTDSELKLLRIHSPKLADEIAAATPKDRNLFDYAADIAGSSRALRSGGDLSMGGRQGLFVAARHPIQWAKANRQSVKFAKDENHYFKRMHELADDPWIKAGDEHDIGLQGAKGQHEEAFSRPGIAEKVPGIRRAERAYTGGLSELRASLWKNNLQRYGKTPEEAASRLGEKGMEGLAEVVRTLTGRGGKTGGFIEKRATTLGEALFSPRLWASRLQPFNPAYWKRVGPAGRKEAFESLGSFAAVAGLVLGAAVAAGAEVETDARSSDFLKIKVGDTRYDILGGFQQNLVFGWRQLSGERKSSQSGKVTKFAKSAADIARGKSDEEAEVSKGPYAGNRLTAAADLFSNKAAPLPAAGMKILAGEDKAGNPVNPITEIGSLFVPIGLQNAFNSRNSPKDVAKGLPEFVGFGSQTYGLKDVNLSDKQKKTVDKITDQTKKEAYTQFYQTSKVGVPDREEATKQIKKALRANDTEKAKQIAIDYNKKYADGFKEWKDKYGKYSGDRALTKDYNSNKITGETLKRYITALKRGEL